MSAEVSIHVLLVEDNPTDVLLTEEALGNHHFHIQSVERLADALKLLSSKHFDVVLLDLGLPDSQGLDTLRTLRGKNPQIAIVVLTGKDDEQLALKTLQEGAQDYLLKGELESRPLQRALRYAVERMQMEVSLRRSQEELEGRVRERTAQLHDAKEAAETANRAKDQFIAVLSHELRTPLTPVLTAVQMMETEPGLTADLREWTSMIRRNVQLEARLIDDLLDVTKIIRGKLELQLEAVDLNVIVRQATKICESDIWSKQLRLTATFDAKDHWVRGDATRLQQILWNLLKNAVKFTPIGGAISIRTENLPDDRISMLIQDTGVGIQPEMLSSIFDAFTQGGSGVTRQFGGLGLGLAIAKGLVEMHGGTLTATSEGRNRGATLTLVLPTTPVTESVLNRTSVAEARELSQKSHKLLLVDDNEDTTTILAKMFRMNGYNVRMADGVASALLAAQVEPFDVLISDIGLPDGSGLDLMAQLSSKVPIKGIVLSGHGMEDDICRSKKAGFALHLTKPISMKVLLQAVREVASS